MTVAAAAATVGREVNRALLTRIVEVPEHELDGVLGELHRTLVLERAADESERYRFRHELLREVAYQLQPPSARRDLHARVADALVMDLVDGASADWRELADHYEHAGRLREAVNCRVRAADEARRRGCRAHRSAGAPGPRDRARERPARPE